MGTATRLLRGLWRALGSTRLAAILLAALLLASLLASLLPQMPATPAAREPWLSAVALRYGQATGLLHGLGLFQATRSPWFVALVAALLLNTLVCTVQRLPRLWRSLTQPPVVTRPDAFYQGFAHRGEWPVTSRGDGLIAAQSALARRRYSTTVERDENTAAVHVYAERGRWAQAGTVINHVAALVLAIAVVARPVLGWQDTGVVLVPGQTYAVGHGRDLVVETGELTIDRHPDGQPRNYRVPLGAVANDSAPVTRTVSINRPFSFRGVSFHLQSYGPAARLSTPEGDTTLAFTGSQAHEVTLAASGPVYRIAYQPERSGLFVEVLDAAGTVLGSGLVRDGEQIEVESTQITFKLGHYTVWQVSHDPTFGLAVGAAVVLLAAMLVSLWVPRQRLWLRVDGKQAQMVGAGDFSDPAGDPGGDPGGDFKALVGEMARVYRPDHPPVEGEPDA
jgi:cytochrome c biogenesis protein